MKGGGTLCIYLDQLSLYSCNYTVHCSCQYKFKVASNCLDIFSDSCDQGMCNLLKHCGFMHLAALRIREVVCSHVQLQCVYHGFHITHIW